MNILSLLLFFTFINLLYLGISTYNLNRQSSLNRLMLILSIPLAIWAFTFASMHITNNRDIAFYWYRISTIGWIAFIPITLHLLLVLTQKDNLINRYTLLLNYLPAMFGIIAANLWVISPDILHKVAYGWVAVPVRDFHSGPGFIFILGYALYLGFGFITLFIWGKRSQFKREKKQVKIIMSTTLISITVGSVFDNILPIMNIILFPLFAPITCLVWVFGFWYAIKKYRLGILNTTFAASEIIDSMNDLLVMVDHDGMIIQISPHTCNQLGYSEHEINSKGMEHLVSEKQLINDEISIFRESSRPNSIIEINYKKSSDELIPVSLSGSALRDTEGDLLGIVFVGYDLRETKKLEEMQRIAERDMNMAALVQTNLFPEKSPVTDEWDVAHIFQPAASVSGDFYDFYEHSDKLQGVSLFDVSGHGISSGLITMIAKSVVYRNFYNLEKKSLSVVMQEVNKELVNEIGQIDNFVTGILLRFKGNTIEYVNAGHTELLCKKAAGGKIITINPGKQDIKGFFLGVEEMISKHTQVNFNVSPEDQIFLYTDCFLECTNAHNQEYGQDRLITTFKNAPEGSAKEIMDYILNDVKGFIGDQPFKDDLTAILLKRRV